jgi:hypothetical protein
MRESDEVTDIVDERLRLILPVCRNAVFVRNKEKCRGAIVEDKSCNPYRNMK